MGTSSTEIERNEIKTQRPADGGNGVSSLQTIGRRVPVLDRKQSRTEKTTVSVVSTYGAKWGAD